MKTQLSRKPQDCTNVENNLPKKIVLNVPGDRHFLQKSLSSISASSDYESHVPDLVDVSDDNSSLASSTNSVKIEKSLASILNVEPYRKN